MENRLQEFSAEQLDQIQMRLKQQRDYLSEIELIDENCEVNKEACEQMLLTKENLSIQLEAMLQRYQQLTNPEENQEQLYLQQMLTNLVREED